MDRRTFLAGTGAALLAAPLTVEAQQAEKIYRIGILGNVPLTDPRSARLWGAFAEGLTLEEAKAAAHSLRVQLQALEARGPDDFERAFAAMAREHAGALFIPWDGTFLVHLTRITRLAAKTRLPALYGQRGYVDAGGLASYGPSAIESFRRAAAYVDKILKGARPGDLPVEQPTKFEFVINSKTARSLGLTIPPSLLARADEVIQ